MVFSTAIAARPSLTPLVEGAARERLLGLALAVAGAGVGFSLGLDLRTLAPLAAADKLYLLSLALAAPLPIAALAALYHAPIHRTLLPWPVSARAHFALGLRMLLWRQWPWAIAAAAAGLGAGWGRQTGAMLALVALPTTLAVAAQLASLGAAGLCALLADAEGPTLTKLRVGMAGPFASPRHAPFFYLPALAFAVVAFSGLVSLVGAVELAVADGAPSGRALGLLAAAPGSGALLALVGWAGYARCGLRTIARVHEEAKTIYGGRPAPAEPPYGAWIVKLLPRLLAPYTAKELREQSRGHRALWALIALWVLACVAYAVNVGAALPAAPLVAALVLVYLGSLPLRRSPRVSGADYLITLPLRPRVGWLGRWVALWWPLSHAVGASALAIGLRHGRAAALALLALALATSLAATGLTIGAVGRRGKRAGWGPAAQLVPALAVVAALAGQRSWALGMGVTAALGLLGIGAGVVLGGRR